MAGMVEPRKIIKHAFPGIHITEAEEMVAQGVISSFPKGTIICREGAIETTFYIILEGEVRVTKIINDSEERVLKILCSGDFFGEMAILHNAPRAATITSITSVTALVITKETFSAMLQRSSSMSIAMVREVSRRLRENDGFAIDDLRQKATELADAYQRLAEQDYARKEFLTVIAHELRTPLMAANGFLQIIQTGKLQGEDLDTAINTVSRNLQEITSLTNDILFLQEMDLILSDFQDTDLGAITNQVVEQERNYAQQNQVGIQINITPGLAPIQADPKSLGRAISAVLENAIKFSPDGGEICVDVGQSDEFVWVKILDHGIGIDPGLQSKIFDRFFHVDCVGDHLFRGLGLGLSIAKQVIDQHGGDIQVFSTPGHGSTFTIHLKK